MKKTLLALILAVVPLAQAEAAPATCAVEVKNEPVVIRMNKDEFRIAFGVTSAACRDEGCAGVIRYTADWRTEDGNVQTAERALSYDIPKGATESIAVDRHYFDTSEAKHTTDVTGVKIADVSCSNARLTVAR